MGSWHGRAVYMKTCFAALAIVAMRCGPLGQSAQPAAASVTRCSMTTDTGAALAYEFSIYTDGAAAGSCSVDGVRSTFAFAPAPAGTVPTVVCSVVAPDGEYVFNSIEVSTWVYRHSTDWMIYRFGPVDSRWECPSSPTCAQEACGTIPGHCWVGGLCTKI